MSNPFDDRGDFFVFITEGGIDFLKEDIIKTDEYIDFIMEIQKLGFIESDNLTFQRGVDEELPVFESGKVKDILIKKGFDYSSPLEKNIIKEFKILQEYKESIKSNFLKSFSKLIDEPKYKIPEIGEKLTLYFYLFVECNFKGDSQCSINLNGNFLSNKNSANRNCIGAAKADFIRIQDNNKQIVFKSEKLHKDFLSNIPFTYEGIFKNITVVPKGNHYMDEEVFSKIEKTYNYNVLEIKHSIKMDNRITVAVDDVYNYNEMIKFSKEIKRDYEKEQKKYISIQEKINVATSLIPVLTRKMETYAEYEEYEKAARTKKDIQFISEKEDQLKKITEKEMLQKKYVKKFHV